MVVRAHATNGDAAAVRRRLGALPRLRDRAGNRAAAASSAGQLAVAGVRAAYSVRVDPPALSGRVFMVAEPGAESCLDRIETDARRAAAEPRTPHLAASVDYIEEEPPSRISSVSRARRNMCGPATSIRPTCRDPGTWDCRASPMFRRSMTRCAGATRHRSLRWRSGGGVAHPQLLAGAPGAHRRQPDRYAAHRRHAAAEPATGRTTLRR